MVALRDTGKEIGIGCDEGTGLSIINNVGTVNGDQGVFIVDVRNAVYKASGSGNTFGVTGAKLHYLTHGDTYDFTTGDITISDNKTLFIESTSANLAGVNNIFGAYETTKAIINLVKSTETSLTATVKSSSAPNFQVLFGQGWRY